MPVMDMVAGLEHMGRGTAGAVDAMYADTQGDVLDAGGQQVGDAVQLVRDLMDDGYYTNPAGYPAVPIGSAGVRFTQTLHHTEEDLEGLIGAIVRRMPATAPEVVVDLTGSAAKDHAGSGAEPAELGT